MGEDRGFLRQRLEESSPALAACLEQSWSIALREWLQAVDPNQGSSNSYPHLKNVELHLDQIFEGCAKCGSGSASATLKPIELYLLLSAVLFHDIGRTQRSDGAKSHGQVSDEFVMARYANLGIPRIELARIIAVICRYHCPSDENVHRERRKLSRRLRDTVLDPYGEIRPGFLAALLTLADCMDATSSRVLPPYLRGTNELGIAAQFRLGIQGVFADPHSRIVRSILSPCEPNRNTRCRLEVNSRITGNLFFREEKRCTLRTIAAALKSAFPGSPRNLNAIENALSKKMIALLKRVLPSGIGTTPGSLLDVDTSSKAFPKAICHRLLKETPWVHVLLALGLLRLELPHPNARKRSSQQGGVEFPEQADLAVLLNDIHKNSEDLADVRESLATSGLHLTTWVVDDAEHLYDWRGRETYEPVFDRDFLEHAVDGMWNLASRLQGECLIPYEELAAEIGEFDVEKVKKAVRRIACICRDQDTRAPDAVDPIWAGGDAWTWQVVFHDDQCGFCDPGKLKGWVKQLSDPS